MPRTSDIADGLTSPRTAFPSFTVRDAKALAARVGSASSVALTTTGTGTFVLTAGGPPRAATVTRVYGSLDALLGAVGVRYGRFLTENEMAAGDDAIVVVSNTLAHELSGGKSLANVLNTSLLLQGRPWTIVGVLDEIPNERTFSAIVPIGSTPLATLSSQPLRPRSLLVRAPRIEDVLSVKTEVEAWADATDARWRKDPQIAINSTGIERLQQLNQGMLLFKMLMGSFAAISLIVGGIGIMNVLLAAVAERTREIGVRKAAGARRGDIVLQFLSESVTISLAGAVLGAALGLASAIAITAVSRWRTSSPLYAAFTWQTMLISMGMAVAVGLMFGLYPALKAARLSPVDAMRYE